MKRIYLVCLVAVSLSIMSCGSDGTGVPAVPEEMADLTPAAETLVAVAVLSPTEGNEVEGEIRFEQSNGEVTVSGRVINLTPGLHGFHVHEVGDCSAPDAESAGGHFNPFGTDHGAPGTPPHHVGDLGNLEADESGVAEYQATLEFLTLRAGEQNSIIGRSVIVHEQADDLTSQPTGAAGGRLACGVVELQ
jgi:superoxide dismutase, Cu-Zn family